MPKGLNWFIHLVAPLEVVVDYKLTRLQQFNDSLPSPESPKGTEENWKLGGAALSVVDRGQNGQDVVGKLIRDNNGDGLFHRLRSNKHQKYPYRTKRYFWEKIQQFWLISAIHEGEAKQKVWVSLTFPIKLQYIEIKLSDDDSNATRPHNTIFYDIKHGDEAYRLSSTVPQELVVNTYNEENGARLSSVRYQPPVVLDVNQNTNTLIAEIKAQVASSRVSGQSFTHNYSFRDPYQAESYDVSKVFTTVFDFDGDSGNIALKGYGLSDDFLYAVGPDYITTNEINALGHTTLSKDYINPVSNTDNKLEDQLLADPRPADGQNPVMTRQALDVGSKENGFKGVWNKTDANGTTYTDVRDNQHEPGCKWNNRSIKSSPGSRPINPSLGLNAPSRNMILPIMMVRCRILF